MSGYLIDTHVWLWLIAGVDTIAPKQRVWLQHLQKEGKLFLSAVSAWEVSQKRSKGKLHIAGGVEELVRATTGRRGLQLIDLTVPILVASNELPGSIHGDPADRMLAATARLEDLALVTRDGPLIEYAKQGHVRVHEI